MLPDRSLCVRCPWHRWAFCVGRHDGRHDGRYDGRGAGVHEGDCVFPPGRDDKKLKLFPAVLDKRRKQIKIGFDSFDTSTLVNETF